MSSAEPERYQEMLRINGRQFQTVTYINSSAKVKALSDWVVTSGNAEEVIRRQAPGTPVFAVGHDIGTSVANRVLPESFRRPVVDAFVALVHGFSVLRSPRLMLVSIVWSVILWGAGARADWRPFKAFSNDLPRGAPVLLKSRVAPGG